MSVALTLIVLAYFTVASALYAFACGREVGEGLKPALGSNMILALLWPLLVLGELIG